MLNFTVIGPQGAEGAQGNQGAQGAQGAQGIQGSQGLQGMQGEQGEPGVQGAQGMQAESVQGPQGFQGASGPQGLPGSVGEQGSAPSSNIISQLTGDDLTTLLVHFDGSDGSTNFTDDSVSPLSVAVSSGTVQIKNTQSKFGGTSAYFNGVNTNVLRATSVTNKINFRTDSFTIEGWFYFNSNNIGYQPLLCFATSADGQGPILILESNNTLTFYASTSGAGWTYSSATSTVPTTGAWHHIAVVGTAGQNFKIYYNGISVVTSTYAYSLHTASNLFFGHYPYFPGGARTFNGYIDEVRISNTARYSSNFTPSASAFETGVLTYPTPVTGAKGFTQNNLYVCTDGATSTWKKIALSSI